MFFFFKQKTAYEMLRSLVGSEMCIRDSGITGGFGVAGENENGRKVIDFCEERGMCVSNTFFKHKSIHKYTRAVSYTHLRAHETPEQLVCRLLLEKKKALAHC